MISEKDSLLKVLIADDDPIIRLILKRAVGEILYTRIVGEAEDGAQLIDLVKQVTPDVIFLDVEMPGLNGVEASKKIFRINQDIFLVFVTAYDDYAYDAFHVYAFDYILKPFKIDRIRQTIGRIRKAKAERHRSQQLDRLLENLNNEGQRMPVKSNGRVVYVNIQDIILVTRDDRKTVIITGDENIETNEPLQDLCGRLKSDRLFRCHRGYVINKTLVKEISPHGDKTYLVRLVGTDETALMTMEKARELKP